MSSILPNPSFEIAFLRQELDARGISLADHEKEAGVSLAMLSNGQAHDPAEIQNNLEPLLATLPDDGFGLNAGARVSIADYGAFGHALLSSHNLRGAHEIVLSYRKILRTLHGIVFDYGPEFFECRITDMSVTGRTARYFTECWLQAHFLFTRLLLDIDRPFERVFLSYDPPSYSGRYEEGFRCAVEFNAPSTGYRADSQLLNRPVTFANEEVRRFCEARCEALLQAMAAGEKTVTRVRRSLLSRPGWFPGADEMAASLGFTSRTFRRRLREENSSYQAVLESVRKKLAAEYLKSTHLTVEDIAHRLGYVEANSFYKAFQRWYGTSPKAYARSV